jgi:hypothetical protein
MRTLRRTVTFDHPFSIPGIDGEQPPGTYAISSDEEEVGGVLYEGWRRVETAIRLPAIGVNTGFEQVHIINPTDLEEALKKDARRSNSAEG